MLNRHFTAPLLIEYCYEWLPMLSKLNYFSASRAISIIIEKSSNLPKFESNF